MIIKLEPTLGMRECLKELTMGRKVISIECEMSAKDIEAFNKKKAENLKTNPKKVVCLKTSMPYASIQEASIATGLDAGAISRCVNKKQNSTKGMRFRFV